MVRRYGDQNGKTRTIELFDAENNLVSMVRGYKEDQTCQWTEFTLDDDELIIGIYGQSEEFTWGFTVVRVEAAN